MERARAAAYGPGQYVEQQSFMRAGEILALARRAGIAPGVSVLDLCCGVAGPGRFITRELGCIYLGVDMSAGAIDVARARAGALPCRFEVARVPPVPTGPFDVVLLLETMLAFPDKQTLLHEVARALAPGGRFAFTMEEGLPLDDAEREAMPDADTVWLTPLDEMLGYLKRSGLEVRHQEDCSQSHRAVAGALNGTAPRLWAEWLKAGRVRKLAFVAEKIPILAR
jgi:SAM-dependent methyltransferase